MSRIAPPIDDQGLSLENGLEALQSSSEFRGPVESLEGHRCTDHFAQIYETDDERFAAAIPFVQHGLERGERCMYVVDESSEREVTAALRDAEIDVDAALESGALSFHSVQDTYLRNGTFNPDEMIDFYAETVADVTEEYEALRIVAETTWLQDDATTVEQFMEYEAKVNELFAEVDCLAICQYDRDGFPPEIIRDIVRTHPHLIYDGAVCHNFYYTPPAEFFGPDEPAREVDRMLGTLRERTEAKTALADQERFLRECYEITSDPTRSFEEKLQSLFELGCERFDLELGGLARVDPDGDLFEVEAISGDHDHLAPGAQLNLSETYCRVVADSGVDGRDTVSEPVGITDPAASGFEDERCVAEFGLDTYLGTRVPVEGDHDRTLFFVSSESRDAPITDEERTVHQLMAQWVKYELERLHRERFLYALSEINREMLVAETATEVGEGVVAAVENAFDVPLAAVALYDDELGELRPTAATDAVADLLETAAPFDGIDGVCWNAFVAEESERVRDPFGEADASAAPSVTEAIVHPLGEHGVLLVGSAAPDGFGRDDVEYVETAAANVRSALDRVDRERRLQDRERRLEEQNRSLERLNRINDTIRSIDRALVEASAREEIEGIVCEELGGTGPYELAWIGKRDGGTGEVTPRKWSGEEKGHLEDLAVAADDRSDGCGPVGRAIETGEPQIVDDVLTDESFGPWRRDALERGHHAVAALPLRYRDTRYGILALYAGQPGVFDELEREVLTELSATVSHAINAIESKKALVGDRITELEFAIEDGALECLDLARELDCTLSLAELVPRSDGSVRAFFSVRGAAAADVLEFEPHLPVTDLRLVSNDDEAPCLFEGTLTDESLSSTVIDHGGRLQRIHMEEGVARVTVQLAAEAEVREFVEMVRSKYPRSELRARRSKDVSDPTIPEFTTALIEELTDRQLETLQTAYYSGYFEEPRRQNGSDIAEMMGFSQPTFHSHVRAATRKLCRRLFEDRTVE